MPITCENEFYRMPTVQSSQRQLNLNLDLNFEFDVRATVDTHFEHINGCIFGGPKPMLAPQNGHITLHRKNEHARKMLCRENTRYVFLFFTSLS